jgi:6-phosphogluconolactonase (cycloisomerase 2 family)
MVAGLLVLSVSVGIALAATHGKLSFVGAKVDGQGGVSGITQTGDVAASRDGKSVYAISEDGDSIATFERNRHTGKLRFVNKKVDGQGGVNGIDNPGTVDVAPNGRSVYVTGSDDDAVATFKRNRRNGKLKFVNAKVNGQGGVEGLDQAWAVVVSPDNRNVYVTSYEDDAIATFKRKPRSGKLRFLNAKFDGAGGGDDLGDPYGVAVSGDGRSAYVTADADNAITTFKRNRRNGKLSFVNAKVDGQGGVDGLIGAWQPTVSGDGRNVYVATEGEGALATFKRNRHSGKLRFVNAKFDSPTVPLVQPYDVVVSRDGRNAYVAVYNAGPESKLDTFKRNRRTGKLAFVNAKVDGQGGVEAGGIWRVAISADDRSLYTADFDDSSVGIFKRHR